MADSAGKQGQAGAKDSNNDSQTGGRNGRHRQHGKAGGAASALRLTQVCMLVYGALTNLSQWKRELWAIFSQMFDQAFVLYLASPNRGLKYELPPTTLRDFLTPQENNPKEPIAPKPFPMPATVEPPVYPLEPSRDDEVFLAAEKAEKGTGQAMYEARVREYEKLMGEGGAFQVRLDEHRQSLVHLAEYELYMQPGGEHDVLNREYDAQMLQYQEALMYKTSRTAEFHQALSTRTKKAALFEKEMVKIYMCIWDSLSALSQEQVSKEVEFADLQRRYDAYGLFDLIIKVHGTAGTSNKYEDQMAAWTSMLALRMNKDEITSAYYRRFKDLVTRLESTPQGALPPKLQATLFLTGLDKTRFWTLQLEFANGKRIDDYTPEGVHAIALNWRVAKTGGGGGGAPIVDAHTFLTREPTTTTIVCYFCKKEGHTQRDCPAYKQASADAIKPPKASKPSKKADPKEESNDAKKDAKASGASKKVRRRSAAPAAAAFAARSQDASESEEEQWETTDANTEAGYSSHTYSYDESPFVRTYELGCHIWVFLRDLILRLLGLFLPQSAMCAMFGDELSVIAAGLIFAIRAVGKGLILMDSASNRHLVNDVRFFDVGSVRDTRSVIGGIVAGQSLMCTKIGTVFGVPGVLYSVHAKASVLSLPKLAKLVKATGQGSIEYVDDSFVVEMPYSRGQFVFAPTEGYDFYSYTHDFDQQDAAFALREEIRLGPGVDPHSDEGGVNARQSGLGIMDNIPAWNQLVRETSDIARCMHTLEEQLSQLSPRERGGVADAKDMMRKLGHPDQRAVTNGLNNGTLIGTNVTSGNMHDFVRTHGVASKEAWMGKTKRHAVSFKAPVPSEQPMTRVDQNIFADVFFVDEKFAFLGMLVDPMRYLACVYLGIDRTVKFICSLLANLILFLKARSHTVGKASFDNQLATEKAKVQIEATGTLLEIKAPGEHVSKAERSFSTVKSTSRAITSGLPYKLFGILVVYLVLHSAFLFNALPSTKMPYTVPAREQFTSFKFDVAVSCPAAFGDIVLAWAKPSPTESEHKSRAARLTQMIFVGAKEGTIGSYYLYDLSTNQVVVRPWVKVIPTDESHIAHINSLADKYNREKKVNQFTTDAVYKTMNGKVIQADAPHTNLEVPSNVMPVPVAERLDGPQESSEVVADDTSPELVDADALLEQGERVVDQVEEAQQVRGVPSSSVGSENITAAPTPREVRPEAPSREETPSVRVQALPNAVERVLQPEDARAVASRPSSRARKVPKPLTTPSSVQKQRPADELPEQPIEPRVSRSGRVVKDSMATRLRDEENSSKTYTQVAAEQRAAMERRAAAQEDVVKMDPNVFHTYHSYEQQLVDYLYTVGEDVIFHVTDNVDVPLCMHAFEEERPISMNEDMCLASGNYSVKAAMTRPPAEKELCQEAIKAEYKQLFKTHKALVPVNRSDLSEAEMRKTIGCFGFLKDKKGPSGEAIKTKFRLVMDGSEQVDKKTLYGDLNASTPSCAGIFAFASIAAGERRHVMQGDVAGAFLLIDMERDAVGDRQHAMLRGPVAAALVECYPEYAKYLSSKGNMLVRLDKSCYGCVQSPMNWQKDLASTLIGYGMTPNPYEKNWYNITIRGVQLSVIVWVDDLFFSCKEKKYILSLIKVIEETYGAPLVLQDGPRLDNIGMRFDFVEDKVLVSAEAYLRALAEGIEGTAQTPARSSLFDVRDDAPKLSVKESAKFHSMVARLLYVSRRVLPEIQVAVSFLTTRVKSPDQDDQSKLFRVLQYINGLDPAKHVLVLTFNPRAPQIVAYIDASYAPHAHAKSQTGGVIKLDPSAGGLYCTSEKQNLVTKSSTEAEVVGLSNVATQVVYMQNLLKAQGYNMPPAIIYQDNMSAMAMMSNGGATAKLTRHINIRYFWVKDNVERGEVRIKYMPTDDMLADVLTKPLQGEKFRSFVARLLGEAV